MNPTETVPPEAEAGCVLVINCGSSSLKFALVEPRSGRSPIKGLAERLGSHEARLKIERESGEGEVVELPDAGHLQALERIVERLGAERPVAIGHRVVHGGERFTQSARVTPEVEQAIDDCAALAPLHNPANLEGIRTAAKLFPELPQVAVFDTAFHQTLPRSAYLYAIPYRFYQENKVRRYGFHGTSHRYVAIESGRRLGLPMEATSLITMHLGNGCSACAVRDGRSVDTTMGFTPSEGLVMGTRSGDVDPALHQFLHEQTGLSLAEITKTLNSSSGLLGLSGLSNDMRTLCVAVERGNEHAAVAVEVFCYRIAKAVAGLTAALERLDALVFTGGIGENAAIVREKVAAFWRVMGVELDRERNARHGREEQGFISSTSSRTPVLVVPTNEELMIARETLELLHQPHPA